jgi:radical SAM protein with 4Fe4S-binding SPASM domain
MMINLMNSQLGYLYISFDGAKKQTFEKIRVGSKFEKIIENVKLCVKIRKNANSPNPKLMFETTISTDNAKEVPQIIKLAESVGVDGIYLYRQVTPGKQDYESDPAASINWQSMPKTNIEIQSYQLEKPSRFCIGTIGCYITFDGKVLPCNRIIQLAPRQQYQQYQFGDLNKNSLAQIWRSRQYRKHRAQIALGKYPPLCRSCPKSTC